MLFALTLLFLLLLDHFLDLPLLLGLGLLSLGLQFFLTWAGRLLFRGGVVLCIWGRDRLAVLVLILGSVCLWLWLIR